MLNFPEALSVSGDDFSRALNPTGNIHADGPNGRRKPQAYVTGDGGFTQA
jgi:hypothetical protein